MIDDYFEDKGVYVLKEINELIDPPVEHDVIMYNSPTEKPSHGGVNVKR